MRVVGLDLSLTATGIAADGGTDVLMVKLPKHATEVDKVARLQQLGVQIDRACRGVDVVVLEGHSFNSQHSHAHSLGELHGVVKVTLLQRGTPFVIVAPTQLKRYAVGRGNATKDEVLAAAIRHGCNAVTTHEADAWFLRHMAIAHYGGTASNEVRRQIVGSLPWPRPEAREAS